MKRKPATIELPHSYRTPKYELAAQNQLDEKLLHAYTHAVVTAHATVKIAVENNGNGLRSAAGKFHAQDPELPGYFEVDLSTVDAKTNYTVLYPVTYHVIIDDEQPSGLRVWVQVSSDNPSLTFKAFAAPLDYVTSIFMRRSAH